MDSFFMQTHPNDDCRAELNLIRHHRPVDAIVRAIFRLLNSCVPDEDYKGVYLFTVALSDSY